MAAFSVCWSRVPGDPLVLNAEQQQSQQQSQQQQLQQQLQGQDQGQQQSQQQLQTEQHQQHQNTPPALLQALHVTWPEEGVSEEDLSEGEALAALLLLLRDPLVPKVR